MRAVLGMVAVAMLATSTAQADTRYELDNLLPLVDPPASVVVQPKADHRIDMLATASERSHDRLWRAIDLTALAVSTAALACDWGQTHAAAADHWAMMYEKNPVLGQAPSTSTVNAYFAVAVVANTALWLLLPDRYKSIVPGVVIGVQAKAIGVPVMARATSLCGL